MLRTFMHSKIHRATVTASDLDYIGSLTVSPELLEAAHIGVHELVSILNINNGARFDTYTILGNPGSDDVIVNGAAARLVQPGDKVIIVSWAQLTEQEMLDFEPVVVHVDEQNRALSLTLAGALR
jgi:aspartate 1-decarboxylase